LPISAQILVVREHWQWGFEDRRCGSLGYS
jgi:hypothetical protein